MKKQKRINLTELKFSVVDKVVNILINPKRKADQCYHDAVTQLMHLTHYTHLEATDVVNHICDQLKNTNHQ